MMTELDGADGRRGLMKALLGTGFVASITSFLYPAVRFMMPPDEGESAVNEVRAAGVDDIRADSGLLFKFGNRPGILVRTAGGELRAFSAVCTHLNCTVQYADDSHRIWCACHNGIFDLNGRVVTGPPPDPLEEYAVNIRGEDVMVSRKG
jgi:Rieske Fe-S protein